MRTTWKRRRSVRTAGRNDPWHPLTRTAPALSPSSSPADFFQECLNAEEGEGCDFLSYVVARGVYDQNGNLYDNNEWEMRESIFLTSYEEAVKNPDITDEEVSQTKVLVVVASVL